MPRQHEHDDFRDLTGLYQAPRFPGLFQFFLRPVGEQCANDRTGFKTPVLDAMRAARSRYALVDAM